MNPQQYQELKQDSKKGLIKSALILFAAMSLGALFGYFCSLISNT